MKIVSDVVRFLNQPLIKEGIKNVAGAATFAFGLAEIGDLYAIAKGRPITSENDADQPKWLQTANKVSIVAAKISLILSAGVSRPGVIVISFLVGLFFTPAQLQRVFGPNSTFAVNPWHPRHVVSIAAVACALPAIALSTWKGINWVAKEIDARWLTDRKVNRMVVFNTITSRPILHLGNRIGRWL